MMYEMVFGKNGGLKPIVCNPDDPRNKLPIGTILRLNGYSNPDYVVVERNVIGTEVLYKVINLQDGTVSSKEARFLKYLTEKVDGRIQTYITDIVLDAEDIMDAYEFRDRKFKERQAEQAKKDQARAEERERLLKEYGYLERVVDKGKSSRVIGAKNIRTELKAKFPGVKFSVTSQSFSMGNSIDISWTGGPSRQEVEAITDKYEQGSFDGMIDLYTYNDDIFPALYGGAKYVQCQRYEPKAEV